MVQYVLATVLESQTARRKGEGELCPLPLSQKASLQGGWKVAALSPSFPLKLGFYIKAEGMSERGGEIRAFQL